MSNSGDELKCINCEYQDLKPCASCVAVYVVDMMLESNIRKKDIELRNGESEQMKNRRKRACEQDNA